MGPSRTEAVCKAVRLLAINYHNDYNYDKINERGLAVRAVSVVRSFLIPALGLSVAACSTVDMTTRGGDRVTGVEGLLGGFYQKRPDPVAQDEMILRAARTHQDPHTRCAAERLVTSVDDPTTRRARTIDAVDTLITGVPAARRNCPMRTNP